MLLLQVPSLEVLADEQYRYMLQRKTRYKTEEILQGLYVYVAQYKSTLPSFAEPTRLI